MNTEVKAPPAIKLTPCDSSQIHAYSHCPETNCLHLQFKRTVEGKKVGGSIYRYDNFTGDDMAAFLRAESKGAFLGQHIKDAKHDDGSVKYPHTKLDPTDI